jgi:hypothetical protein
MKSLDGLSYAAVDAHSFIFDFGEGYGERWEIVSPDVSDWDFEQLREWSLDNGMGDVPSIHNWEGAQEAGEADEFLDSFRDDVLEHMRDHPETFEPMMNYAYPLPGLRMSPEEAQAELELAHVAVVVVLIDGEPHLALSGGGMDLSWDICWAYLALGYLPPFRFTDLPRFSGMKLSEDVEWVLRACERSAEAIRDRAVHALGRLQEHREDLFRATLNDIPEGMPLPILADWLEDHDRGEEAGKVREALGASQ